MATENSSIQLPPSPDEELQEVFEYLKLSYDDSSGYSGTSVFHVLASDDHAERSFYIRVAPHKPVEAGWGLPKDGDISVYTTMSRADFFHMYSGTATAAEVTKMVFGGRISVKRFRFRELQKFANAFSFNTGNWVTYYRWKGKTKQADELMRNQWKIADRATAEGVPTYVTYWGTITPVSKLSEKDRIQAEEERARLFPELYATKDLSKENLSLGTHPESEPTLSIDSSLNYENIATDLFRMDENGVFNYFESNELPESEDTSTPDQNTSIPLVFGEEISRIVSPFVSPLFVELLSGDLDRKKSVFEKLSLSDGLRTDPKQSMTTHHSSSSASYRVPLYSSLDDAITPILQGVGGLLRSILSNENEGTTILRSIQRIRDEEIEEKASILAEQQKSKSSVWSSAVSSVASSATSLWLALPFTEDSLLINQRRRATEEAKLQERFSQLLQKREDTAIKIRRELSRINEVSEVVSENVAQGISIANGVLAGFAPSLPMSIGVSHRNFSFMNDGLVHSFKLVSNATIPIFPQYFSSHYPKLSVFFTQPFSNRPHLIASMLLPSMNLPRHMRKGTNPYRIMMSKWDLVDRISVPSTSALFTSDLAGVDHSDVLISQNNGLRQSYSNGNSSFEFPTVADSLVARVLSSHGHPFLDDRVRAYFHLNRDMKLMDDSGNPDVEDNLIGSTTHVPSVENVTQPPSLPNFSGISTSLSVDIVDAYTIVHDKLEQLARGDRELAMARQVDQHSKVSQAKASTIEESLNGPGRLAQVAVDGALHALQKAKSESEEALRKWALLRKTEQFAFSTVESAESSRASAGPTTEEENLTAPSSFPDLNSTISVPPTGDGIDVRTNNDNWTSSTSSLVELAATESSKASDEAPPLVAEPELTTVTVGIPISKSTLPPGGESISTVTSDTAALKRSHEMVVISSIPFSDTSNESAKVVPVVSPSTSLEVPKEVIMSVPVSHTASALPVPSSASPSSSDKEKGRFMHVGRSGPSVLGPLSFLHSLSRDPMISPGLTSTAELEGENVFFAKMGRGLNRIVESSIPLGGSLQFCGPNASNYLISTHAYNSIPSNPSKPTVSEDALVGKLSKYLERLENDLWVMGQNLLLSTAPPLLLGLQAVLSPNTSSDDSSSDPNLDSQSMQRNMSRFVVRVGSPNPFRHTQLISTSYFDDVPGSSSIPQAHKHVDRLSMNVSGSSGTHGSVWISSKVARLFGETAAEVAAISLDSRWNLGLPKPRNAADTVDSLGTEGAGGPVLASGSIAGSNGRVGDSTQADDNNPSLLSSAFDYFLTSDTDLTSSIREGLGERVFERITPPLRQIHDKFVSSSALERYTASTDKNDL